MFFKIYFISQKKGLEWHKGAWQFNFYFLVNYPFKYEAWKISLDGENELYYTKYFQIKVLFYYNIKK